MVETQGQVLSKLSRCNVTSPTITRSVCGTPTPEKTAQMDDYSTVYCDVSGLNMGSGGGAEWTRRIAALAALIEVRHT